jgi:hypothetical protein
MMSYLDVGGGSGVLASSSGVLARVALVVEIEGSTSGDGITLAGALLGVVRGKVGETEVAVGVVGGVQVLEGLGVARGSGGSRGGAGKCRVGKEGRGSVGRGNRAGAAGLNGTGTTFTKGGRAGAVSGAVGDINLSLTSQDRGLNGSSSRVRVVDDNKLIGVGRDGDVRGSLNSVDQREVELLRNRGSERESRSSGQQNERAHDGLKRMSCWSCCLISL